MSNDTPSQGLAGRNMAVSIDDFETPGKPGGGSALEKRVTELQRIVAGLETAVGELKKIITGTYDSGVTIKSRQDIRLSAGQRVHLSGSPIELSSGDVYFMRGGKVYGTVANVNSTLLIRSDLPINISTNGALNLEGATVSVESDKVRFPSASVDIRFTSRAKISAEAASFDIGNDAEVVAGRFIVRASLVHLRAPKVDMEGLAKAQTVQCNVITSQTYTPGAGNVW